jgi:hypothetical protein
MTVEDGVLLLAAHVGEGLFVTQQNDTWAAAFVKNVAAYVMNGKALSTEQGRIILKLMTRVQDHLIEAGVDADDLRVTLAFPRYRQPPYPSANVPREVRYLGDNFLGFRFKRNDAISSDLKAMVRDQDFLFDEIWFHPEHRVWVVPINRDTIEEAMGAIKRHRFQFDDAVAAYLADALDARNGRSNVSTDRDLGLMAAQVKDNEMLAWIVRDVLMGQPV